MPSMQKLGGILPSWMKDSKNIYFFKDRFCPLCGRPLQAFKDPETGEPRSDGACPYCGWQPDSTSQAEINRTHQAQHQLDIKQAAGFLTYTSFVNDHDIFGHAFANFIANDRFTKQAKAKAEQLASQIGAGQVVHSNFHGPTGTGKTHLAVAVANQAIHDSNYRLRATVINSPKLMQERQRMINAAPDERREFNRKMAKIKQQTRLLILDDLGAESSLKTTDFDRQTISEMINDFEDKSLIITTNQVGHELHIMYGQRTISRILKHSYSNGKNQHIDFAKLSDHRALKV